MPGADRKSQRTRVLAILQPKNQRRALHSTRQIRRSRRTIYLRPPGAGPSLSSVQADPFDDQPTEKPVAGAHPHTQPQSAVSESMSFSFRMLMALTACACVGMLE